MKIAVERLSKNNGVVLDAIMAECMNHNGCKVERKDGFLVFPADCDKDCRERIARQMCWAFGGKQCFTC